jgi:hypothetical protein
VRRAGIRKSDGAGLEDGEILPLPEGEALEAYEVQLDGESPRKGSRSAPWRDDPEVGIHAAPRAIAVRKWRRSSRSSWRGISIWRRGHQLIRIDK